jgi:hypothetical protein
MAHLKHREIDELYARITPEEEERSQKIAEEQRKRDAIQLLLLRLAELTLVASFIWWCLDIASTNGDN